MDLRDLCSVVDNLNSVKAEEFLKMALYNDLEKLNQYSLQKLGFKTIYYNSYRVIFCAEKNFSVGLALKSFAFEIVLNKWNDEGMPLLFKKIDEFAEYLKENCNRYTNFANKIITRLNNIDFLKMKFIIKEKYVNNGFLLYDIHSVSNIHVYKEIALPLYKKFEDFDEEDFINDIKKDIFRLIKEFIICEYNANKKKLSLDNKYRLVHIAVELADFDLAKLLNEHRSKLPRHLKEKLFSIIMVSKLSKIA